MPEGSPNSGHPASLKEISADELLPRWNAFRAGGPVACPRDGGPMSVAVDALAHAYRLICVSCGATSPWFEARPQGIHLRTGTSSMPAAARADSEKP